MRPLFVRLLLSAAQRCFVARHKLPVPALGRALDRLIACCERAVLRNGRRLPFANSNRADPALEIHSLLCESAVGMFLWALRSFDRFGAGYRVVLHDDGTLTDATVEALQRQVPGIRIHRKRDADLRVAQLLEDFPSCREFRASTVWGVKLFDFNLLTDGGHILALDADVLFFQNPAELLDSARRRDGKIFYMDDGHAYSARRELLARFGKVVEGFNAGVMLYPRGAFPLAEMEEITRWILANPGHVDRVDDQLVYAIMSAAREHGTFSAGYTARPEHHPRRDALVCKHYMSTLKLFFSLEGLRHALSHGPDFWRKGAR